jgi:hypothetical protein
VVMFRTFLRELSAGTPASMTDDFHSFSQSSQVNFEIVHPLGHDRFLTNPFQLFYSPVTIHRGHQMAGVSTTWLARVSFGRIIFRQLTCTRG